MPAALSYDAQPICYSVQGQGEPHVILVHGWSCDQSFWRNQVPFLASECTVVTLDLAGHGASGSGRARWTIRSFAKDVIAVLSELAFPQSILVGHSMGGAVALEAARVFKNRVIGIIAVDSLIYPTYSRKEIRDGLAPLKADFRTTVTKLVGDLFPPGADAATVAWASQVMASAAPEIAIPSLRALLDWDFRPSLAQVDIPVVCICSAQLAADIDLSQFGGHFDITLLPNTGHFPMLEIPSVFNEVLAGAIRAIAEGRGSSSGRPA